MGKPLVFAYGNAELSFDPTKIDRSVLYGFKEVEVLDERGQRANWPRWLTTARRSWAAAA